MTIDEKGIAIYSKEEVEELYQREREKQLALTPEVKELREILNSKAEQELNLHNNLVDLGVL